MNLNKGALKHRNQLWLTLITFSLMILVFDSSLYAEIWTVLLTAESDNSTIEVFFGLAQDATDDYDVDYDVALPPPSPETAAFSISFANELAPLEKDIRGPGTSGKKMITWTLNIGSDAEGKLLWDTKSLPAGWNLTVGKVEMQTVGELFFDQGRYTLTITAVADDFTNTYKVTLREGINFISVPLDPSPEADKTPWRLRQLLDFIGPAATMIIGYDQTSQKFAAYMPHFPETSSLNTVVRGGEGYIVMMKKSADVVFTGTAWENTMVTSEAE